MEAHSPARSAHVEVVTPTAIKTTPQGARSIRVRTRAVAAAAWQTTLDPVRESTAKKSKTTQAFASAQRGARVVAARSSAAPPPMKTATTTRAMGARPARPPAPIAAAVVYRPILVAEAASFATPLSPPMSRPTPVFPACATLPARQTTEAATALPPMVVRRISAPIRSIAEVATSFAAEALNST